MRDQVIQFATYLRASGAESATVQFDVRMMTFDGTDIIVVDGEPDGQARPVLQAPIDFLLPDHAGSDDWVPECSRCGQPFGVGAHGPGFCIDRKKPVSGVSPDDPVDSRADAYDAREERRSARRVDRSGSNDGRGSRADRRAIPQEEIEETLDLDETEEEREDRLRREAEAAKRAAAVDRDEPIVPCASPMDCGNLSRIDADRGWCDECLSQPDPNLDELPSR